MTGASRRTSSVSGIRSPVSVPGVYMGSPVRTISSSCAWSPSTIAYLGSSPVVNRAMRMVSRVVRRRPRHCPYGVRPPNIGACRPSAPGRSPRRPTRASRQYSQRADASRDAELATPITIGGWPTSLAHLHAWHIVFEGWVAQERAGAVPAYPAEGYAWDDIDTLNDLFYQGASRCGRTRRCAPCW